MNNNLTKIGNWISTSFQLITVGLLIFAIVLILKQQKEISNLKRRISSVDSNVDDVKRKLDDIESNLISEFEDTKRTSLPKGYSSIFNPK